MAESIEPLLRVIGLHKTFKREDGTLVGALCNVSLDLFKGECVVLLGPSGCGKTTLLRSVAGLEAPEAGTIHIAGREVFGSSGRVNVPPERRGLSMIFQSYALWPHMSAFDNVAYPLEARGVAQHLIRDRVAWALRLVGLQSLGGQYPGQLSGGQQQRVALARAIVPGDELVLFDEPLSNVDAKVRAQVRMELRGLQLELGFSALYVTHDQDEALELADRVAVMADGEILQLGAPIEIYQQPNSARVANFVGRSNELLGTVQDEPAPDGHVWLSTPIGKVLASAAAAGGAARCGEEALVLWRPESCTISREPTGGPNCWPATVHASVFLGAHCEDVVELAEGMRFFVWRPGSEVLERGTRGWLSLRPDDLHISGA